MAFIPAPKRTLPFSEAPRIGPWKSFSLVSRVVDPDGDGEHASIIQAFYLYDQGQVVLEFQKGGEGEAEADDLAHRYLWNPAAVDQLLADEQVASLAAAGETLWALTDHLGTVRDLADNNGVLRKHLYYDDAFGRLAGADYYDESGELIEGMEPWVHPEAVGADQRFYFTGRYLDRETGLQNNLNRWYDASTGRWISEDPVGFAAGDANLTRYVGSEPVGYIDPSGLNPAQQYAQNAFYGGNIFRDGVEGWNERRDKIETADGLWWRDFWKNYSHYLNPFIDHHAVDWWDTGLQGATRAGQAAAVVGWCGAAAATAAGAGGLAISGGSAVAGTEAATSTTAVTATATISSVGKQSIWVGLLTRHGNQVIRAVRMSQADRSVFNNKYLELYEAAKNAGYHGKDVWKHMAPQLREWVKDFYQTRLY